MKTCLPTAECGLSYFIHWSARTGLWLLSPPLHCVPTLGFRPLLQNTHGVDKLQQARIPHLSLPAENRTCVGQTQPQDVSLRPDTWSSHRTHGPETDSVGVRQALTKEAMGFSERHQEALTANLCP